MSNAKPIITSAALLSVALALCGVQGAFAADKEPILIGAAIAQSGFVAAYDTDPA